MAIRKNKRFIDPRYFMDEKTDKKAISEKVEVAVESFASMQEEEPPTDPLDAVMDDISQEHYGFLNTPSRKATFASRVLTEYWDDLLPNDQIGLYKLAVQLYASGIEDEAEIEMEPAPEEIEVEPAPEEEEDVLSEKGRTAKGNITQKTREKYATVGKDKYPIFDKKSAEAAIDLRGHTSKANQKKIINKAAKYAPKAAKKARKAEKK